MQLTEVESAPEEQSDGEPERPAASRKACWDLTWSHKGVLLGGKQGRLKVVGAMKVGIGESPLP